LPLSLRVLKLGNNFNKLIDENVLPPLLKRLKFGIKYNKPINKNVLPLALEYLEFNDNITEFKGFNKKIEKGVLPESLLSLQLGQEYQYSIENVLPACGANNPTTGLVLPKGLTELKLGGCFNKRLEEKMLSTSLRHLTFGYSYSHSIKKNILPKSLEELHIYKKIFPPEIIKFNKRRNINETKTIKYLKHKPKCFKNLKIIITNFEHRYYSYNKDGNLEDHLGNVFDSNGYLIACTNNHLSQTHFLKMNNI